MIPFKIVLIALGVALAWYLLGSFIAASFDVSTGWAPEGRFIFAVAWAFSSLALIADLLKEGRL